MRRQVASRFDGIVISKSDVAIQSRLCGLSSLGRHNSLRSGSR
jgi:hypothetical protein